MLPTLNPQQTQAQKLRILLASIKHKVDQNLPLTPAEDELLAECHRQYYMKPKEAVTFDSAGTMIVKRAQDAEPVMEAMKAYGDLLKHSRSRVAGAKMVGSIDSITASIWAKECGSGIGTKEFSAYAKKKLSDPDYRRFRVGG